MSHSNSSLNCFANCMAKYKLNYIDHIQPDKISPHLTFGTMAHDVLYKAGKLRDEVDDCVVDKDTYYSIIPSEVLYNDLKTTFGINNWEQYFFPIIKKIAQYEKEIVQELSKVGNVTIDREIKMSISPEEFAYKGITGITQPLVGIIDLLIRTDKYAVILDYKFSSKRKTQDDFDMNSQLPIYAMMVHNTFGIPLHNIKYGYIDIPKQMFDKPVLLSNGTLSRSKSQNVSQDMYEKSVIAIHGDDEYYNCKPGGYYHDCWCNLALNTPAYLSLQWLDMEVYNYVTNDIINTAQVVDTMINNKMTFCKKYDSFSCGSCEYLYKCKPWLTVQNDFE